MYSRSQWQGPICRSRVQISDFDPEKGLPQ
jgi:hypothetical protein